MVFNTGGPVWGMEWAPVPDAAAEQYIAVASYRDLEEVVCVHVRLIIQSSVCVCVCASSYRVVCVRVIDTAETWKRYSVVCVCLIYVYSGAVSQLYMHYCSVAALHTAALYAVVQLCIQ